MIQKHKKLRQHLTVWPLSPGGVGGCTYAVITPLEMGMLFVTEVYARLFNAFFTAVNLLDDLTYYLWVSVSQIMTWISKRISLLANLFFVIELEICAHSTWMNYKKN